AARTHPISCLPSRFRRRLPVSAPKPTRMSPCPTGCPLLAQSGHGDRAQRCPLLGVKRTSNRQASMSANDAVDGARSAASKCYKLVASKPGRFKEVRPGNDDGVLKFGRNWRGHDDVMQTRSIRGSGEPAWVSASLNACLRLGPDPRRALWPAAT